MPRTCLRICVYNSNYKGVSVKLSKWWKKQMNRKDKRFEIDWKNHEVFLGFDFTWALMDPSDVEKIMRDFGIYKASARWSEEFVLLTSFE